MQDATSAGAAWISSLSVIQTPSASRVTISESFLRARASFRASFSSGVRRRGGVSRDRREDLGEPAVKRAARMHFVLGAGARKFRLRCTEPVRLEVSRKGIDAEMRVTEDGVAARYARLAGDHALQRIGTAEEVAEGIEYLVRAEWVTGVALDVDGGLGLGVSSF